MRIGVVVTTALLILGATTSLALSGPLGPSPYLSFADSPFVGLPFTWFHLEDFEDGALNVPGLTASIGVVFGPAPNSDSVDGDDGVIDGFGTNARSWFSGNGVPSVLFTFNQNVLGTFPTHVGLVWTDGANNISFEAFNAQGASLGTINGSHANATFTGETAEDRFYGFVNSGGISAMRITSSIGNPIAGGLEVDHLQYGYLPTVPVQTTTWGALKSLFTR